MNNKIVYEEIESSIKNDRPIILTSDFVLSYATCSYGNGKSYKVENALYEFEGELFRPWLQYERRYDCEGWFVGGSVDSNNYSWGVKKMFKSENRHIQ